ncbi:MAG: hypothetical protein JO325_19370 [Solirubrobacterales bacterium]|nr:hypothetical protein [Solirubrobacterales bacterium]
MLDQQPTIREPPRRAASGSPPRTLRSAATMEADAVLDALGSTPQGLSSDNDVVARKVCADIGLEVRGAVTGSELDTAR